MKWNFVTTGILLAAISISGCASTGAKSESCEDQKNKQQAQTKAPGEIASMAAKAFADAPGLTEDQKQKLLLVYSRTYSQAINIRTQITQSKSLLFKLVVTNAFNSPEVDGLKKKIVDLDQDRLNVMFKALADVQKIVGSSENREEIFRHFQDYEIPRGELLSEKNN